MSGDALLSISWLSLQRCVSTCCGVLARAAIVVLRLVRHGFCSFGISAFEDLRPGVRLAGDLRIRHRYRGLAD
jgi:hypothetical protein